MDYKNRKISKKECNEYAVCSDENICIHAEKEIELLQV